MIATKKLLSVLFTGALAASASAADYYVALDGTYEGAPDGATVYTSLDEAIAAAGNAADVIYVKPGMYTISTQHGPNLKAKLVGAGTSRDDVTIQSSESYRTLRMAAGSWLENVTVVGNTDITKVDKGGAIEMSGGTVTNCVVRDGTAKGTDDNNKNAGGNIYSSSTASLIVDCVISGGRAQNRGGNVCLDQGTLRNCTITGGSTSGGAGDNNGGNVWTYQGKIENCAISGGSAVLGGNVFVYNSVASITGGTISGGTATQYGGNVYLRAGTISKATISGGTMAEVSSGNYGGGNVYADGNAVVSECVILGGSAYRRGGNVYAVGGATIQDCAITNGTCSANIGGNIYMEAATVTNSTVYGGSAPSGRGGNIFLNNAASLVTDCTIENGTAGTQGGNVYVGAGAVSGSTIANGTSVTDGGNVFMAANTVVSDCVISNGTINSTNSNWDGPKGVNVNLNGSSAKLLRCHVSGGATTPLKEDGSFYYERGSVAVNNSSAVIDNCLVEGCACGGVVMQSNGYLYSSTVVNNDKYGIWAWNDSAHVFNTVIYGNTEGGNNKDWTGNMPNGTSAAFLNNALTESGSRHSTSDYPTVVLLADSSAFADYANGDYKPAASSALVDAGATDTRADASTTDLLGNPRTSGRVDIGCYEYQKSEMTVTFAYAETPTHAYAPLNATFVVSAQNVPEGETPTFTINFGDGTALVVTTENSVSHLFENPGVYTVVVSAVAPGADNAEMTYEGYVSLASSVVYVTPGNLAPAFPYATPETGYATLKEAYDASVDGMTILVGAGINSVDGQIDVTKAVTIRGAGAAPTDAVLRNVKETADGWKYRVMQVNNAAARIENLTLENGRVLNQYGGNLRVAAGIVSNCVIRGGTATASNGGNAAGGGLVLGGQGGIVTHCQIVGNLVDGTSNDKNYAGAAVFVEYGSKDVRLSNLLVANNRYVSTDATKSGSAGVRYGGGNDRTSLENCTIVANTVEGTLPEDSAGLYCTSWHTYVRNCVIVGNYETGKQKYTSVKLDFSSGSGFSYLNNFTDDALIQESGNKSKDNQLVSDLAALFKNFANGDYRPKTGGALVDKGTTTLSLLPSVDLAGNVRQKFRGIDVGCYECERKLGFSVVIR